MMKATKDFHFVEQLFCKQQSSIEKNPKIDLYFSQIIKVYYPVFLNNELRDEFQNA